MKKVVIIVAGGVGKRMGGEIPKQFLLIHNKTILHHTIDSFYNFDSDIEIIVSINPEWEEYWTQLSQKENVPNHTIVKGGKERFHSVKNAIDIAPNNSIIGVHDAVRPLVSIKTLKLLYSSAEKNGNSTPVTSVSSSLRKVESNSNRSVDRSGYKSVQTPQCFTSELIKKAYQQEYNELFTDDASVVEQLGEKIFLIEGNPENIKITTPFDLKIAELILK